MTAANNNDDKGIDCKLIATSSDIYGEGNHPQGVSFSPDGLCALTTTVGDSKLRLYNTITTTTTSSSSEQQDENEDDDHHDTSQQQQQTTTTEATPAAAWKTALVCRAGDAVRSYAWYPHMKSNEPASCCFVAASRDQPIHLFDAYTGTVRASYRPYNALDEMESPTVTTFGPNGQRIWAAGFRSDRTIHVFDTARPGRDSFTIYRLGKTRRSSDGQKGLISSLECSADRRIFVVGTYSPGSIYVYDDRSSQPQPSGTILNGLCVVGHGRSHSKRKRRFVETTAQAGATANDSSNDNDAENVDWLSSAKIKWFLSRAQGGVTQMQFDNDSYMLYSVSRRSNAVLGWDLRMLSGQADYQSTPVAGVASFATDNATNQRLEFALHDNSTLFVGGRDKCLRIYDIKRQTLIGSIDKLDDACNGVSFTQLGQTGYLAIATGSRRFPDLDDLGDESTLEDANSIAEPPGFLHLYKLEM